MLRELVRFTCALSPPQFGDAVDEADLSATFPARPAEADRQASADAVAPRLRAEQGGSGIFPRAGCELAAPSLSPRVAVARHTFAQALRSAANLSRQRAMGDGAAPPLHGADQLPHAYVD